ncbi:sensor histidine kinase [Micromonospora sp. MW-13]|uniref:sensor histidine kinase n=1 Tax=Micromonospora sp. MW-13 TaxID=2094022 RepID=UPI001A9FAE1D|nr:ATP-binding protein [Micromonospora sp. MW-13]
MLVLISAFGLLAVPADALPLGLALFGLIVVGAVVDCWAGFSGRLASLALTFAVARVTAICVTQEWSGGQPNQWALNALTATAITMQWDWPPRVSLPVTAGMFAVNLAVVGVGEGSAIGLRLLVECVMARLAFVLLRQSSRRVDSLRARRAALTRAGAVAVARHRQERELLALLHDTASATFLMVATHGRDTDPGQVAEYARHDLMVLTGTTGGQTSQDSPVDLNVALRSVVDRSPLTVDVLWRDGTVVPASVALALVRAVREALTNVERHANVRDATLSIHVEGNRVVVTVDDVGVGFCPGEVPHSRRGIRGSVIERLTAAGGSALVTSRLGAGTSVRLVWPGD